MLKPEQVKIGMPVTICFKGNAFCNSVITGSRIRYGSMQVFVKGNYDEFGDEQPVALNDLKPLTNGYYETKPTL